ncbi:hypothetical protein Csa_016729 [Cucumis sativus]|uniref:Uncharacterized protein n=1 Tax=Cucumis sativus TaxID=3659 RepID=A0A0A0K8M5_CUCSA|nr:hypothetical protein Csa_016729 [Cucumis sativus]
MGGRSILLLNISTHLQPTLPYLHRQRSLNVSFFSNHLHLHLGSKRPATSHCPAFFASEKERQGTR